MSNIQNELKQILVETMIPECEEYLEKLHKGYENNTISEDDKESIRDMESFLVELQNILLIIKENKMTDKEAEEVYLKISRLINEHEEYEHDH